MTVEIAHIQDAARLLQGQIVQTPTIEAPVLGRQFGCELFLKLENLQLTGSFKTRGALVCILGLSDEQKRRGVVAMSAGNHAQGVAWHAGRLGIPATIVMPRHTAFTKIERTESLGARVVLEGESLSEAEACARGLVESDGLALIHPYDDERIIMGQGTVALEMMAAAPDMDIIVVPVGGGGLAAGMSIAGHALAPKLEIIGVQAEQYPSMWAALRGEERQCKGNTLAEGIGVKRPGQLTRPVLAQHLSDLVLVSETALERSVQSLMEVQKVVAEGAGAAALAAISADPGRFAGKRVGIVISGGNLDARVAAQVLLRGLARAGRIARLRIEIPDLPGTLARIAQIIGDGDGNIIEITHQRLFHDVPVKSAEVDIVVETTSLRHIEIMIERLEAAGYPTRLLSSTAEQDV